ncbi:uncharacterized protein [Ptychodera flava]|uniref:uncharacterized protein n=1 Tax=Ptychodera flava TaxID=63121 RepID=UPI003969FB3D
MLVKVTIICGFLIACAKLGLGADQTSYPQHASCKADWTFALSCTEVHHRIRDQVKAWMGPDCGDGIKCRYTKTFANSEALRAKHTTPDLKHVDVFTMVLSESDGICKLKGSSSRSAKDAVFDNGANYCAMHNLIVGSKLNEAEGYTENTGDNVCTQYSSANCDVYQPV